MFRTLKADKDTYITNRYINSTSAVSGNVGIAGSLDLFKLYGMTLLGSGTNRQPVTELSRMLVHFDLDPLRELVAAGKVDLDDASFKCHLNLKDVYGGQTTPSKFTVAIFPLSASFDEGLGKDVVYYSDKDKANFLSTSSGVKWFVSGCGLAGASTSLVDYITSTPSLASTKTTQYFPKGTEDLLVDVTNIVSATLTSEIPDQGFRISFDESNEVDQLSYFVKRFGSRQTYDESKRPKLLVRFDDSIADDTANFTLDNNSNLFLYNYVNGELQNLLSSSTAITGTNSLILELKTNVSGVGNYSLYFTGSQYKKGKNFLSGVYYATANVPLNDTNIKAYYNASGSVRFTPIWQSFDGTLAYVTGSKLTARGPDRLSRRLSPRRYTVGVLGITNEYLENENVALRVNVFDDNNPIIKAQRLPVELPGLVIRNSHFAVRDNATGEYVIPFDTSYNSTRLSSDSDGMYFNFSTSALTSQREYVVDIMLVIDGMQHKYLDASPVFRIRKL